MEDKKALAIQSEKSEQSETQGVFISRYQKQLQDQWAASHGEDEPAPFMVGQDGKPVWLNRKTRRMLEKRARKEKR